MTYIYRITNNINGKTYIGQHKLPKGKTPMNDGYYGSGTAITRAEKKYGIENFTKEIIVCFFGDVNKTFTNSAEIYYIEKERKEKGKDNVYNIQDGGHLGLPHTEESKLKMSKSHKGLKASKDTKEKMSLAHKNPSKETREKMSKSRSGSKNGRYNSKAHELWELHKDEWKDIPSTKLCKLLGCSQPQACRIKKQK